MKSKYLLVIAVTAALMYFFFKRDHASQGEALEEETAATHSTKMSTQKSFEVTQPAAGSNETAVGEKVGAQTAASAEQQEEVQKNFSNQLRQLGQCLAVQVSAEQDKINPQYDNLANSLTSGFGNMLVKMDDWTQWEGQTSDGSVKRVRTEIEYLENNIPTKRVQLYKLNAQGMPEMQPLDDDVALNPTDEYLDSLRSDARTIVDEKASRAYYAEGEELVVVERNGKIQSFSMSKGEKTFSCTDTDSTHANCQCL